MEIEIFMHFFLANAAFLLLNLFCKIPIEDLEGIALPQLQILLNLHLLSFSREKVLNG